MAKQQKTKKNQENKGLGALGAFLTSEQLAAVEADKRAEQARSQQSTAVIRERKTHRPPAFHNPYNFIPAPPRDTASAGLGDCKPISHSSYDQQSWSGQLKLQLITQTPLLIPDAAKAIMVNRQGHQSFPLRWWMTCLI